MRPETHDARSGDVNITAQVLGTVRRDPELVPGWVSNIDEDRGVHRREGAPGEGRILAALPEPGRP